ncbi:membrane protein [Formosimonas limnophila]|uniref:Membrane protein n=1 Tax=Formosimonas limnophila TaxID=1384487 RepID=A0A8J3FYM0_9BURK|nr:DUF502 domain-containing protein [Formosimonas limnophila]GHA74436.1 membrane protein [Formosimonas limnophila]
MRRHFTSAKIRNYLVTGIFVWVPIIITVAVIGWGVGVLQGIFTSVVDAIASVLPAAMQDEFLNIKNIPGLGVILVILLLFTTGMMAANFLGQWFLKVLDQLLSRIPIVKSVYGSVKQVSDTLFSSNGQAFRQALLVQYPRAGVWTVAFQTGSPSGDVAAKLPEDCLSVYVPTTPNPTSGFFLIMKKTDVVELDMSVDEALKYIISMGVVSPNDGEANINAKAPPKINSVKPNEALND